MVTLAEVDQADDLVRRFAKLVHDTYGTPVHRRRNGEATVLVHAGPLGWIPVTCSAPRTRRSTPAVTMRWALGIAPPLSSEKACETDLGGTAVRLVLSAENLIAAVRAEVPLTLPAEALVELALAVALAADQIIAP